MIDRIQPYREEKDPFTQIALRYLLKNPCKLPQKPEDPQKFTKRRRKVEIAIKRLQEQLKGRLPQGRDLTNHNWLETLSIACQTDPEDTEQARSWQDKLLTKSQSIPFPINYETNEDLIWYKNEKGRLYVHFNGISDLSCQSNILVGVSMGIDKPATVAVVDGITQKILTIQYIKQLLGNNYPLIDRQRRQKQHQSHKRNVAQRKEAFNQFGESDLGEYIDLIAYLPKPLLPLLRNTKQEASLSLN